LWRFFSSLHVKHFALEECMKFGTISLIAGTVLALGVSAGLAWAGPVDDIIKARQACMKGHGGVMAVAVPIMKGEKPFDAAALKVAYDAEAAACADWDKWWGADTQKGETVETFVKPELFTDKAGFDAAGAAWYAASQKLQAATDEASFKAAFPAVGAGCQGCHEKYRRPKS
jgi:cytochrome c556